MCAALLRNNVKLVNLRINTKPTAIRNVRTTAFRSKWHNTGSTAVENNLLRGDNLTSNYQLIYRAPLEKYVTWTKNVSTVTVSIIGSIAGYHLMTSMNFMNVVQKIDISMLVSNETDLYFFAVGFVLINLAIRVFVSKYPLRIYKSVDKYVAVYESQMPVGKVKHYFERGQIAEYRNVLNPWSHIMFKLGQRSSMLMVDYFKRPSDFHDMFKDKDN